MRRVITDHSPPDQRRPTMALTQDHSATTGADAAAVAELQEIVERQRAAFLDDPHPSLEERQGMLQALAGMVMGHRMQIQEAMSADFAVHPTQATDLIEVLGVAGRAAYAAERLEQWMAREPRDAAPPPRARGGGGGGGGGPPRAGRRGVAGGGGGVLAPPPPRGLGGQHRALEL